MPFFVFENSERTIIMVVSKSLSEYLNTIYVLSLHNTSVRTTDISKKLGISKPSVNRAVNSLKQAGLVSHRPYEDITLTDEGLSYSKEVYSRHENVKAFLLNVLHINPQDAEKEACIMEHGLSQNTIDKMISFMER
mgnify:CR=1 FL=1